MSAMTSARSSILRRLVLFKANVNSFIKIKGIEILIKRYCFVDELTNFPTTFTIFRDIQIATE